MMDLAQLDNHAIFGILSILASLVAISFTAMQVYKGELKPHVFSFIIWFVVTAVAFFNLTDQGAGPAAWRTGFVSLMMLIMFFISARDGFGYVTKFDVISLVAALTAIPIWLVLKNPDLALMWVMGVELVGVLPTLRKAFESPSFDMHPMIYGGTSLALVFQLLSLPKRTPILIAYFTVVPALVLAMNVFLFLRRRRLKAGAKPD